MNQIPPTDDATPDPTPINLRDALEERYLSYALSTIMHRALPDVRDGLKPVHRRLLYAMRQLRLDPDAGFKKCARVVGDVIGKYHPHGDQAVYDALVRLAQNFAVRYPLVDGQGNFGNVDGDNAAAMRYTEARLTEAARALLDGIDEDTVDFRATYDGEESEPAVLPAALPNLLANGAAGIAVGMATNIPPHNVDELCAAAQALIARPDVTAAELAEIVPGPDFPTGGVLVEDRASIADAYATGRGGFRVRARWHREDTGRGTWQIVVTEIPYQVQKSRLIEKIAELLSAKKLPHLGDVRDESTEDIRIVLEPRARTVAPDVLMEQLFRFTELESRVSLNMNVLSGGQVPRVLGLREVLSEWLAHRKEVLGRRSRHRLAKIEHRLEVLGGYLVAYLNIDEVIHIIREEDHPKAVMMERFDLSDVQAEAILNMRLRALRKLEEFEIRKEHDNLTAEKGEIEALLASDDKQWARISEEIGEARARFGKDTEVGRRRTDFGDVPQIEVDLDEALIEREPITVILSEKGWVRALKGHGNDLDKLQFKTGDQLKRAIRAQTTDKLILFASNGKFYTLSASDLPGGRGAGEPVRLMIDLEEDAGIVDLFVHDPARKLLIAASGGNGFIVSESEIVAATRKGKQALNLGRGERAVVCTPAVGDSVAVVGDNRKLLVFGLSEMNEMSRGRGIRLQRYRGASLSDARCFTREDGLQWTDPAGRVRTVTNLSEWTGSRASAGKPVPRGFPKSGRFGENPFASS